MEATDLVHSTLPDSLSRGSAENSARAVGGCFLLISSYRQDQPEREDLGINLDQSGPFWIIELCLQTSSQMCMGEGKGSP